MTLHVLSIAWPLAPVSRDAVGGAEQILATLDAALVEAGHRSTVIACEGSRVAGGLIATKLPPPPWDDAALAEAQAGVRHAIRRLLARAPVDLIHLHGLDFASVLPACEVPCLVTLHLPPAWYPHNALTSTRAHLVAVSHTQRRALPQAFATVPNGVSLAARRDVRRRDFVLWLGRICEEKAPHRAIDIAKRAGLPLLLAGQVHDFAAHRSFFTDQLLPRLDARRRYLGPAGVTTKRRLLAAARCLLITSEAEETSSLVAMEALAAGTPVVALRRGALPEIVQHGRTGLVADRLDELVEALHRIETIDGDTCRAEARARFGADRMVRDYLGLYAQLARVHA
ncbi:MAG: glycosyl transferase family 1 [Rhodospirillales bacterium]|nr:glycosyl transferase family 1 [Rhodospirillales bacterium]